MKASLAPRPSSTLRSSSQVTALYEPDVPLTDASPQILRIIIHIKSPAALAVNPHRHYVSETRRFAARKLTLQGNVRNQRSRNRLSRAARPARAHHAGVARHVAKGARESFRHFRTLYRAARKRQGQRLDRAAAPGLERDGRASGRSHSLHRTRARLGGDPRSPAQGDAGARSSRPRMCSPAAAPRRIAKCRSRALR